MIDNDSLPDAFNKWIQTNLFIKVLIDTVVRLKWSRPTAWILSIKTASHQKQRKLLLNCVGSSGMSNWCLEVSAAGKTQSDALGLSRHLRANKEQKVYRLNYRLFRKDLRTSHALRAGTPTDNCNSSTTTTTQKKERRTSSWAEIVRALLSERVA